MPLLQPISINRAGILPLPLFTLPPLSYQPRTLDDTNHFVAFADLRRTLDETDDFEFCIEGIRHLYGENENLQVSLEDDCGGLGTTSARCAYSFDEACLEDHANSCLEAGGHQLVYEELRIRCNARHVDRENGALVRDEIVFQHVPECLPQDDCDGHFGRGLCENFADFVAKDIMEADYREEGYHEVVCWSTFVGCESTNQERASLADIAMYMGIALAILLFCATCFCYCRRKGKEAEIPVAHPVAVPVEPYQISVRRVIALVRLN